MTSIVRLTKFSFYILVSLLLVGILGCVTQPSRGMHSDKKSPDHENAPWKGLTLREKIGQTMIVVMDHQLYINEFGSIDAMLKQYPIGGIFVPSWIYGTQKEGENAVLAARRAVDLYQDAVPWPLIITEDFERGMGEGYHEFTFLPPEMSVGAANEPELARQFGHVVSKEAKTIGVNWLLHPVADLNMHPLNSLILDRATGDDAGRAYPLLKAQILGMKGNNVIATAKHFPGDGATMKNQHLITSANNLSMKEWNNSFGRLFQQLIDDDVPSIMVGHIRFPAYQTQKMHGVFPPATLSRELMTGLLKNTLGFKGVVMSDALNMGGVAGYYPSDIETAVQSFIAGADIVLWPNLRFLDEVEKRILSGEIPMSRLNDALARIWRVRAQYGLIEKKENLYVDIAEKEVEQHRQIAKNIAKNAVTLIQNRHGGTPLDITKDKKIALMSLSFDNGEGQFEYTAELLRKKGFEVSEIIHNPYFYSWQEKVKELNVYDKIIVAFGNRNSDPMGGTMLKGGEAMGVWTANFLPFDKVIAVSYGNPYYPGYYLDTSAVKVNAYGYDKFSQEAVVEALVGEIPFAGTTPVKLDHAVLQ